MGIVPLVMMHGVWHTVGACHENNIGIIDLNSHKNKGIISQATFKMAANACYSTIHLFLSVCQMAVVSKTQSYHLHVRTCVYLQFP